MRVARTSVAHGCAVAGIVALCACTSTISVPQSAPARPTLWAFAIDRDARVDSILRTRASQLDAVVDIVLQLDSLTGQPAQLHSKLELDAPRHVARIALITTRIDDRFHPATIRTLAASMSARNLAASRAAALVADNGAHAVIIDFETQGKADLPALLTVLRTMSDTLHAHGDSVGIQIPGADTAAYPTAPLLRLADFLVLRLDTEHWSTSAPGAVASTLWARHALATRVAEVGADRLVALLPVYSYLWRNNQPGEMLSFSAARAMATESSVDIVRDQASQSLHAVLPASWELWLTDASLLNGLEIEVRMLGVQHVALRQLGLEDPDIWSGPFQTISRSR